MKSTQQSKHIFIKRVLNIVAWVCVSSMLFQSPMVQSAVNSDEAPPAQDQPEIDGLSDTQENVTSSDEEIKIPVCLCPPDNPDVWHELEVDKAEFDRYASLGYIKGYCPPFRPSKTPKPTSTPEPTHAPTSTPTPKPPKTPTFTPTVTFTATAAATLTWTPTATPTETATVTPSETLTATPTETQTATVTASATETATPSLTYTATATESLTPTATLTNTLTPTATATATQSPTMTSTLTPTLTATATSTGTVTPTDTLTPTATPTATLTPSQTLTATATATPTLTQTPSVTASPSPTLTPTPTSLPTSTNTPTATNTPTLTPTSTPEGCDFSVSAGDVYGPAGLVAAINQANQDAAADTICLAPGAYVLSVVDSMNTGLPAITTPIEIQGNGAALIREQSAPAFRIFRVTAGGQLVLNTVSVSGGSLSGADGGAIHNASGTVVLVNSLITGNAARSGGAIYNENGAVSVNNSDILSNSASTASGGGILNIGLNSVLILTDSTIGDNNASTGGGIYNSNGAISATGSSISDNSATSAGGLFNSDFGVVEITGSAVANNTSLVFGGGVAATGASLTINNSCLVNNVSPMGSGIVNLNTEPGSAPINAEMDWWGAANGPSGDGPGSGDAVSGNIDYTPFLTAPPAFCPPASPGLFSLIMSLFRMN